MELTLDRIRQLHDQQVDNVTRMLELDEEQKQIYATYYKDLMKKLTDNARKSNQNK